MKSKKRKKPFGFTARMRPFRVQLDIPCVVSGYGDSDRYASFYRPIPVKKGDVFKRVEGGILLNGKFLLRPSRPSRPIIWRVAWVPNRLRVAVFRERDRVWSRRLKRYTKKLEKPYWVACDLTGYHVGVGDDVAEAVKRLIRQCQATNLMAEEEKVQGKPVVRWRCLLGAKEMREMERKAKKTGFILDGVEVPPLPKTWQRGLERLRKKAARK